MKRLGKYISLVMSSIFVLMATSTGFNSTVKANDRNLIYLENQAVLDTEENYLKEGYYDDVIYQETFSVPIVMNGGTELMQRVPATNATLSIHYTESRGVWLSLLVEVYEHSRRALIESVSGVFKHRRFGYTWNEYPFSNQVFVDRWAVNTEYTVGKGYRSGEQIHAQVIASAKLREGYIPQFTRTAIATIP